MVRKGRQEEIFSKAMCADDPAMHSVKYRDFENIVEVSMQEFVELSESMHVKRGREGLYRKLGH